MAPNLGIMVDANGNTVPIPQGPVWVGTVYPAPSFLLSVAPVPTPRMIAAPARCLACRITVDSPATGLTLDRCQFCGGHVMSVPGK